MEFISGAAKALFSNLHLFGWAFDIELIYMAEKLRIPIVEIPVTWREVDGSKLIRNKLDSITTSLTMASDIICVWLAYTCGVWTLTQPRKALIVSNAREEL
jgi:dolichyl-phosphate beta-glucosyltransferase